jgi:HK97 family phage major capsid protein
LSFKVPTLTNSTKAILTAEATTYSEVEPTFGEVSFDPYKYTKLVKASEEVLADSRIPVESMVSRDAGNAFALAENEAFSVGSGSSAPQGAVTGATVGVTTSATNAITVEEVIDLYHALAEQYRPRATWLMKDSTLKIIRKFRDNSTTGAFLWQPSLQAGEPPTLMGRPVYTVPDMAAATTGLKAICFGDLSYFSICDFQGLQVQRMNELYAETGQVGFRWFKRFDSNVMLAVALQVLKIA